MFWGLIMEPQRRYTQQVKKSFHISMAALDISTSSDEPAQVMCGFEGRNYLLCTLQKSNMLQCPLDLNFDVGSEVSFAANGKCHVHLTGYLTEELLDTVEEEVEEEEQQEEIPVATKKRTKKSLENGPPNKKIKKKSQVSSSQGKLVDPESDDSDLDVNALLEKSLPDSDDDSSFESLEGKGEEEDEEEEESDEGEEEEESSLSEEEKNESDHVKSKLKVNGTPKKQEKGEKTNIREDEAGEKKGKNKFEKKNEKVENKNKENDSREKKILQGGVIVEDIKEGHGPPAKTGKFVHVYYEGRLKQNNKVFDATTKGNGFSFRLGNGEVIKGWDIGVLGMKPGGKRRITCPPAMAYGQKGSPPVIPPNSTLIFELELKKIS